MLWSDDHAVIGRRFPLDAAVARCSSGSRDYAESPALTGADNVDERLGFADLVEAYIPLALDGGARWRWRCTSPTPGSRRRARS